LSDTSITIPYRDVNYVTGKTVSMWATQARAGRGGNAISVIPAQAGIQAILAVKRTWIPVFTGMTEFTSP